MKLQLLTVLVTSLVCCGSATSFIYGGPYLLIDEVALQSENSQTENAQTETVQDASGAEKTSPETTSAEDPAAKEKPAAEAENETKQAASKAEKTLGTLTWHTDYAEAYLHARTERKQLFIYFFDPKQPKLTQNFETTVLAHRELVTPLGKVVRVILPWDVVAPSVAKADEKEPAKEVAPQKLLSHISFQHMQNKPGIAMIDLVDAKDPLFGQVVSAHPFEVGQHYTVPTTRIVLGLPRGTITQRTLVYAVRTHPEAPQSAQGQGNAVLFQQANHHSALMAQYGSVGHHDWGTRSSQIASQLGVSPTEVAATSWGGRGLIDAANEVVAQWRGSSSHWWMVYAAQGSYGYDMVRTPSGAWYATGIFTGR